MSAFQLKIYSTKFYRKCLGTMHTIWNSTGSILVYALILVNFAVVLAYIIFLKSSTLMENARYSEIDMKQTKNIAERANFAFAYEKNFNGNGSGFLDTRACTSLTMSGTATGSTYLEAIDTEPAFDGASVFCSGSSIVTPGQFTNVYYTPDFQSFSGVNYRFLRADLTGTTTLTGVLADIDETQVSLTLSGMSGIDANFNSDDYRYSSTGTTLYPWNYADDDDLARKFSVGYIRKDGFQRLMYWNTKKIKDAIRRNTNNTGALAYFPDATSTGYLRLDIDSGYGIRVVEFDSQNFEDAQSLKILNSASGSSASGAIGYLQDDFTIASGTGSAKIFDLKNKLYWIFFFAAGAGTEYFKYKFSFYNEFWAPIYSVPLDDSSDEMKFYGNDILIDSENNYIYKEMEVAQPK